MESNATLSFLYPRRAVDGRLKILRSPKLRHKRWERASQLSQSGNLGPAQENTPSVASSPCTGPLKFWKDAAVFQLAGVWESILDGYRTGHIRSSRSSEHQSKPPLRIHRLPSPRNQVGKCDNGQSVVGQPSPYWNKDQPRMRRKSEKEFFTVTCL